MSKTPVHGKSHTQKPAAAKETIDSQSFSQSESFSQPSQSETRKHVGEQSASILWVDKYKPSQMKQIIGQTGDKSHAKKLLHWLTNWHKNQAAGVKPVTGKFFGRGGSDDGAGFKAALLSGPPGIGKTTTATLVCKVKLILFFTRTLFLHQYRVFFFILYNRGALQMLSLYLKLK